MLGLGSPSPRLTQQTYIEGEYLYERFGASDVRGDSQTPAWMVKMCAW
jgi:hypothetical protein